MIGSITSTPRCIRIPLPKPLSILEDKDLPMRLLERTEYDNELAVSIWTNLWASVAAVNVTGNRPKGIYLILEPHCYCCCCYCPSCYCLCVLKFQPCDVLFACFVDIIFQVVGVKCFCQCLYTIQTRALYIYLIYKAYGLPQSYCLVNWNR